MADLAEKVGLLLVNLGTPDAPRPAEVRRFLREFLYDPRVLDVPRLQRFLILELLILPRRPRASAEAYQKIWTEQGSPLLVHGRELSRKLQLRLGTAIDVRLAMRYGRPSIESALDEFERAGVTRIAVLPLAPQYSAAATGSTIERVLQLAGARWNTPYLQVIPPFYDHPAYLDARADSIRPFLADAVSGGDPERVYFSFHGVPERQIRRSDPSGAHCLQHNDCCASISAVNRHCYRAQCYATARELTQRLGLPADRAVVCFQSRLGRTPWLRPYTDELLAEDARRGVRNALIVPSFVADCLETLEELGMRAVETWRENGGETLRVVPALNSDDAFVEAVVAVARDRSSFIADAIS